MSKLKPLDAYDMLSAEFQAEAHSFFDQVHAERPVFRMPGSGVYLVTRHEDLRAAAIDYETFSNRTPLAPLQGERWKLYEEVLGREGWGLERALNKIDPPEHRRSRKYLDAILNGRRVEALKPRIEEVANMLIDKFIDRGECEFVGEFAYPMPSIIIAEQVGFDVSEIGAFKDWSLNLTRPTNDVLTDDELREAARIEAEMQHYFYRMMEERRRNPKDDFLTRIVFENIGENVEGRPLTVGEIQNVIRSVISGGFGTLINMLGTAMYLLITHPDQMRKLRDNPDLLKNFIEEALRMETSVQILTRVATRDVELGGVLIPKGSVVGLYFGAANHDERKFACPHGFDIERENASEHVSFNTGPHLCPGRLLARQELQIAFAAILRRMENIELARPVPDPPFIASWRHRMLDELPIRFTKAA